MRHIIFLDTSEFNSISYQFNNSTNNIDKIELYYILAGADPGFQVRGGALKKIVPSGGRLEIFGVFRVKNHDFTPKNHIFSYCGGRREHFWGISYEQSRFYAKNSYFFNFRDPPLTCCLLCFIANNCIHAHCGPVIRQYNWSCEYISFQIELSHLMHSHIAQISTMQHRKGHQTSYLQKVYTKNPETGRKKYS